jgi:transcriptional regulator with XRE-family HTH domain
MLDMHIHRMHDARTMKLETYLRENGLTDEAFASLVGISQSQVSRIKRDKSWPTRDVMKRIAVVTDGAVTANDFVAESAA